MSKQILSQAQDCDKPRPEPGRRLDQAVDMALEMHQGEPE
jgi:hypothetical protein